MRGAIAFLPPQPASPAGVLDSGGGLHPKNGHKRMSTIMVVEDDILTRMATADHLRDCGYRVLEASDAGEARTLLNASEPVELVFSDINMPGMSGLALAAWIAKEFPDVKIVLTSGDNANERAAAVTAIYLEKPYDLNTLGQLIQALV